MIAAVSANHTVSYFKVKHSSSWSGDHSLILMSKINQVKVSNLTVLRVQGREEVRTKNCQFNQIKAFRNLLPTCGDRSLT